jgi:hypothetical protein
MRPAPSDDPGLAVVRFIYEQLRVDSEWSVREGRGFTWWGWRVAQRVRAEKPRGAAGAPVSRVHAETDFLRSVPEDDENIARIGALLQSATLSAVRMDDAGSVSMTCAASFEKETPAYMQWLFFVAIAFQVAEVETLLDGADSGVQGLPAVSRHPSSGPRTSRAGMLDIVRTAIVPEGKRPSRWEDGGELALLGDSLLGLGARPLGIDALGLMAEIPFGPRTRSSAGAGDSIHLRVSTREEHPRLGCGLYLRLRLPLALGFVEQTRLALRLNGLEHATDSCPHLFGSWCPSQGPGPTFVVFAPNAVHAGGLLRDLVAGMMERARWIGELYEDGGLPTFSA